MRRDERETGRFRDTYARGPDRNWHDSRRGRAVRPAEYDSTRLASSRSVPSRAHDTRFRVYMYVRVCIGAVSWVPRIASIDTLGVARENPLLKGAPRDLARIAMNHGERVSSALRCFGVLRKTDRTAISLLACVYGHTSNVQCEMRSAVSEEKIANRNNS